MELLIDRQVERQVEWLEDQKNTYMSLVRECEMGQFEVLAMREESSCWV